jgi:hypothetical protein
VEFVKISLSQVFQSLSLQYSQSFAFLHTKLELRKGINVKHPLGKGLLNQPVIDAIIAANPDQ